MDLDEAPDPRTTRRNSTDETSDPAPSDECLMERVRADDRAAFDALVDRYWPALVVYCEGIVRGRDAAKDVVQQALVNVWSRRDAWSATGTVSAYLYRSVRNLALNERRRLRNRREWVERSGGEVPRSAPPPTPEEARAHRALRREMEAAIGALPERRRRVFVLARFHGLSYREIGDTMGIARQTVANQMSAALAQLRKALAEHRSGG